MYHCVLHFAVQELGLRAVQFSQQHVNLPLDLRYFGLDWPGCRAGHPGRDAFPRPFAIATVRAALMRTAASRSARRPARARLTLLLWFLRRSITGCTARLPLQVRTERVPPMRIALLIVAALVAAIPAFAHSWYPLTCCGNSPHS
jgi:hypothetical protein